jgi:hypothetical protein
VSVWHNILPNHGLSGAEGELISIRVATDPRALEDMLECLASLSFPVNPEIHHGVPTIVEFPAWQSRLFEVRHTLTAFGFEPSCLEARPMIDEIATV